MSSVSSLNPTLASLIQNLTQTVTPLASSPALQTALEKAPPGDIAELSEAAIQLQSVNALFGIPDSSSADSDNLFASLESAVTGTTSTPSSPATLTAGTYTAGGLAASQVDALFATSANLFG